MFTSIPKKVFPERHENRAEAMPVCKDYYTREIRVSGYYSPVNLDIFRFLNNLSLSEDSSPKLRRRKYEGSLSNKKLKLKALERQAKLGISYRVQVPIE